MTQDGTPSEASDASVDETLEEAERLLGGAVATDEQAPEAGDESDGATDPSDAEATAADPAAEEFDVDSADAAPEPEVSADEPGDAAPETEASVDEPGDAAPETEASADEPGDSSPGVATDDEIEVGEEAEAPRPPSSPYDLPGSWYVIHSYSGYENKVKANLTTRITSMHTEDSIFDIVIPMEDVVEIKSGRKVTVPRKQFPGYVLVRMYLDDESWSVVRNTPGVTGFVGSGTTPTPLSRREVERILGVRKDDEKKVPRFKPDWEVGETVRVIDGPFADFNGVIEDINVDQSKVRVLVDIFGRETPVELNFEQIQKF
jgi:transcription termination/antitermination protein NusG